MREQQEERRADAARRAEKAAADKAAADELRRMKEQEREALDAIFGMGVSMDTGVMESQSGRSCTLRAASGDATPRWELKLMDGFSGVGTGLVHTLASASTFSWIQQAE